MKTNLSVVLLALVLGGTQKNLSAMQLPNSSHGHNAAEENTCSICLESNDASQPILHLDCNFGGKGHSYHLNCIHSHIQTGPKNTNIIGKTVSRCPNCNADAIFFDTRNGNRLHGMNRELTVEETNNLRAVLGSIYVSMSHNRLNNQAPHVNDQNHHDLQLTEEEKQFIATTSDNQVIETLLSGMSEDELRLNGYEPANDNDQSSSEIDSQELYYLCPDCNQYHRAE